jgi:flagellar biogenesis protein FliO
MFQQVLAIFLVLALLGLALWFLRSRGFAHYRGQGRRKSARHLESVARLPLTPHHSVHLIRVSDHTVLLALSPSGCTLIERMPWNAASGAQTAESEAAFSSSGSGQ